MACECSPESAGEAEDDVEQQRKLWPVVGVPPESPGNRQKPEIARPTGNKEIRALLHASSGQVDRNRLLLRLVHDAARDRRRRRRRERPGRRWRQRWTARRSSFRLEWRRGGLEWVDWPCRAGYRGLGRHPRRSGFDEIVFELNGVTNRGEGGRNGVVEMGPAEFISASVGDWARSAELAAFAPIAPPLSPQIHRRPALLPSCGSIEAKILQQ